MFHRIQHVHFVGVGGIGMSGIAEVLLNMGFRVSGSDLRRSDVTARLEQLGAKIYEGHSAAHVNGAHVVVRSTAVRADNPEVLEARRRSIPVIPRAEMLGERPELVLDQAIYGATGKAAFGSPLSGFYAGQDLDALVHGCDRIYCELSMTGGLDDILAQHQVLHVRSGDQHALLLKLPPIQEMFAEHHAELRGARRRRVRAMVHEQQEQRKPRRPQAQDLRETEFTVDHVCSP